MSPQEIVQSLSSADNFTRYNYLAEQLYIKKYVEWEIKIIEIFTHKNGTSILGDNVQAVFKIPGDISAYKKGDSLVVYGRIAKAMANTVVIDDCKIIPKAVSLGERKICH